jgi:hypothetical protein
MKIVYILNGIVQHWHVKDTELVLGAQESSKHEGEWPKKPRSQY